MAAVQLQRFETKDLGPNMTGEMVVKGPNVTAEYWGKPKETADSFSNGWFLTGDIGYMDEDGYFLPPGPVL